MTVRVSCYTAFADLQQERSSRLFFLGVGFFYFYAAAFGGHQTFRPFGLFISLVALAVIAGALTTIINAFIRYERNGEKPKQRPFLNWFCLAVVLVGSSLYSACHKVATGSA